MVDNRVHIERRQFYQSPHSDALDFLARRRAFLFGRTVGKRRSSRRLFQESWPVSFEGFPASTPAGASSNQEADAVLSTRHFSRIKRRRDYHDTECNRRAIKTC